MAEPPEDEIVPNQAFEVTAEAMGELDSVRTQYERIREGRVELDRRDLTDFEAYTKFLDRALKDVQQTLKKLPEEIDTFNQWWSMDDEAITEDDLEDVRDHASGFVDRGEMFLNQYERAKRARPPEDCERAHERLVSLIEESLQVVFHCYVQIKIYVKTPEKAVEQDHVSIDRESETVRLNFGDYTFDVDGVLEPWKSAFKQRRQRASDGDFVKLLASGAMDLYMVDMWMDF